MPMFTKFISLNHQTRAAFAALFSLSWPVILSRLGIMLMGFVDTIMVGHYSAKELGFHGLAWAASSVFTVTSIGLVMGIQVKTAHHLGAGDHHFIGAVFQRGMVYALGLGLGSACLLWVLAMFGMNHLVTQALAKGAFWPIIAFAVSMPFNSVAIAGAQFLEALGRTRESMMATLCANALNFGLLLFMVPGIGPFSGAFGAASATLIARIVLMIIILIVIFSLKQTRDYDLLARFAPDAGAAREQRRIGYAAGGSYFIEVIAFSAMTFFAGRLGETSVAAWVILLNFASVVFMVPMGLSAGCSVLVGRAFGAKDVPAMALMGRVSFVAAMGFMALVVLFVLLFSGLITQIYTSEEGVFALVQSGLLLSCLFFIPDGLQVVAAQALRARKDIVAPTVIQYLSYGAIMIPLGYLFCLYFGIGVNGLVWAVIAASWVSGPLLAARFIRLDSGGNPT